jgi:hypothetical protein
MASTTSDLRLPPPMRTASCRRNRATSCRCRTAARPDVAHRPGWRAIGRKVPERLACLRLHQTPAMATAMASSQERRRLVFHVHSVGDRAHGAEVGLLAIAPMTVPGRIRTQDLVNVTMSSRSHHGGAIF